MREGTKVRDFSDSALAFQQMIDIAEGAANTDWEINFVSDLSVNFGLYGMDYFLSEKQFMALSKIVER
jgi:hypothetical protein